MKKKFKLPKKNKLISAKMSIVIVTMLLLIMGVGFSKFSTTLTINGTVTGNYTPVTGYDYIVEEEEGESGPTITFTTPEINSTNPISIGDLLTKEFDGINISERYIDRIDVTVTYTTTTGSVQSVVCMLTVNNVDYHQTITFGKKKTNENYTVSFTGLNISPAGTFKIVFEDASTTNKSITLSNQIVTVHLAQ